MAYAKGIINWINDEESTRALRAKYGSIENYAMVEWYAPPRVAAIVEDHFEGK